MKGLWKHLTLGRLAFVTALTLSGIVGLQVHWLYTSYHEQKARFTADVENALSMVSIHAQLRQLGPARGAAVDSVINPLLGAMRKFSNDISIKIDTASLRGMDGVDTYTVRSNTQMDARTADSLLTTYKQDLGEELAVRSIGIPFELAFTDEQGRVRFATVDKESFGQIPIKSSASNLFADGMSLQAAFPDANLFLLRRMAWILGVSTLLMVIGVLSFSYLLLNFFRQKKIAEIRNDFMNNMTHEIKTPISAVSVALEAIGDTRRPLDETTRNEYLHIAQDELKRLTGLLDQVLRMAAFERSEVPVHKTDFNAKTWLHDTLQGLRPLLDTAGTELEVGPVAENLKLFADKTQLGHVLQNLLENAVKYGDKPVTRIKITVTGNTDVFTVTVADNGRGIPQAYVGKVFDKFFRVPAGDRHDVKGYGLGLSYVKNIVALHGGSIHLHSRTGEGSTFTLQFPQNR